MPVFNAGRYVAGAVEAILAQTHTDLKLLVVDDGSSDDSAAVVAAFDDPRIVIDRLPHAGLVAALNHGIERAGEWQLPFIARMDADDLCDRTRLAVQLRALRAAPA